MSIELTPREMWTARLAAFEPGVQGDSYYQTVMDNLGLSTLRGRVLDIGMGPKGIFHLEAVQHNPDLQLASVGAVLGEKQVTDMRQNYWADQLRGLDQKEATRVHAGMIAVAGFAQQLPFQSDVFDLTISHAAIPVHLAYSHEPINPQYKAALSEALRVTKPGGSVVLGPMYEEDLEDSNNALDALKIDNKYRLSEKITVPGYSEDHGVNDWYRLSISTPSQQPKI